MYPKYSVAKCCIQHAQMHSIHRNAKTGRVVQ